MRRRSGNDGMWSRRRLVATLAGFPWVVRASALGLEGHTPPSDRIVMGAIGVGNKGSLDMREFLGRRDVQVRAVCDVDARARNAAKACVDAHYGDTSCMATVDFRDIIAREDIDAVLVATPDHWHATPVIEAARAGKHVFCQKPLSYNVAEGRAMVEAVRRHGVVFQHGTQRRPTRPAKTSAASTVPARTGATPVMWTIPGRKCCQRTKPQNGLPSSFTQGFSSVATSFR